MRLALTALINFNDDQKSYQDTNKSRTSRLLIDPWELFNHLKGASDNETDVHKYHQGLINATLSFRDLSFRHQYLSWIYSMYSQSATNRERTQRNEQVILLNWSRQFNHYHHHLKIIKIEPIVDDHQLKARFQLIGFTLRFGHLSFNFRTALEDEYQQNYDRAFTHLEHDEGDRLVKILGTEFDQYFPEANFTFVSQDTDPNTISQLKPVKFNPKWINYQQQKSAAESRAQFSQLQKICNSVVSSANARSGSDSQIISGLQACLQSTLNERASLATSNSQEVLKLNSHASSLSSNVESLSKSTVALKNSLSSQQSDLSDFHSQAISYSSLAAKASNQAANISNQSNASATAANSTQISLHSNVANQVTINHQLTSQVSSLNHEVTSASQSTASLQRSLISHLSDVQSQATSYSLADVKDSLRAINVNSQFGAFSVASSSVYASLSSEVENRTSINHQLKSQVDVMSSNAVSTNQSTVNLKHSLEDRLSRIQSQAANYSLSVAKASTHVDEINSHFSAFSTTASSIQYSLRSDVVNQLDSNRQLNMRIDSLSDKLLKANSLSDISAHNASASAGVISALRSRIASMSASAVAVTQNLKAQSNSTQILSVSNKSELNSSDVSQASKATSSNDIVLSVIGSSASNSSVEYASDYDFDAVSDKSLATSKSWTFAQPVNINKNFESVYNSSSDNVTSEPHIKWGIKRETNYIPIIIIVIIVIIILVISLFMLLKS